jgi:flavin reductase (DIM6/NTAB) family NADH-FMN oxidoreductase RutF
MERHYHLLYPMRAVLVSCAYGDKENIITAAWCFPLSMDPLLFGISLSKKRFSYSIIEKSMEFVINIPGEELAEAVEICGTTSGRNSDKWHTAKLTRDGSMAVKAPSVLECLASIECKVINAFETGDHVVFVGEALHVKKRKSGKGIYTTTDGLKII